MKTIKFIGAIAISMSLFACAGAATAESSEENTEKSAQAEVDYEGMELVDLSEFLVNASMQLPDESKGPRKIQNSATESIEIMLGDKFGIELIPFGLSITEKQEELNGDLVYNIEYLEETPDKIVYKKTIKDSKIEPEFHFFLTKEINGEPFSVKSLNKAFRKKAIEKMVLSAESLTEQNPA